MRHRKKFNHLGRKKAHREAMLANMTCSLFEHKRIKTTIAKAKALKMYAEPLITKAKTDDTHSRRVIFSYLKDKESVTRLFRDISVKVGDRPGGYTRILKLGNRLGDNASMCYIELVDYNENLLEEKTSKKSRSRRGGKKAVAPVQEAVVETPVEEAVVEEVKEEAPAEVVEEANEVKAEEKKEE